MAICSRCKINERTSSHSYCPACRKEIYAEKASGWKAKKPEKVKKVKPPISEQKRRRNARTYANRSGIKKQPCFICGSTEKLEMHHEDYSKPLEVIWLCHACHVTHHRTRL